MLHSSHNTQIIYVNKSVYITSHYYLFWALRILWKTRKHFIEHLWWILMSSLFCFFNCWFSIKKSLKMFLSKNKLVFVSLACKFWYPRIDLSAMFWSVKFLSKQSCKGFQCRANVRCDSNSVLFHLNTHMYIHKKNQNH